VLLDAAGQMKKAEAIGVYAAILDAWLDSDRSNFRWTRKAADGMAYCLKHDRHLDPGAFLSYAAGVFEHTGYLKDYRALRRLARRADRPDVMAAVDPVVRSELPDIWILRALARGDVEAAIDCWFDNEGHGRLRLCADELVEAAEGHVDVLISGRLSVVDYCVGRGSRRHYRRACRILSKLRKELEQLGELDYWPIVVEDVENRYQHRPALLDEMAKAGFVELPDDVRETLDARRSPDPAPDRIPWKNMERHLEEYGDVDLDQPWSDVLDQLPTRLHNALEKGGFQSVRDIARAFDDRSIRRVDNIGRKSLRYLRGALSETLLK
jgi:hypothetical protein